MVGRLALILALLAPASALGQEGRLQTLRFGRELSFDILTPFGWEIDYSSANQLAHFVMHESGTTWRHASSVVYARLVPRTSEEKIDAYIEESRDEAKQTCPALEYDDISLEIKGSSHFVTTAYECLGSRHEIVAVTEIPKFFFLFVLSSKSEESLRAGIPAFQAILSSFAYREPPPKPKPIPTVPNSDN